jgi:hypothetical protein
MAQSPGCNLWFEVITKSATKPLNRFLSMWKTIKSTFLHFLNARRPLAISISKVSEFPSEMIVSLLLRSFQHFLLFSSFRLIPFHGICLLISQ